MPSPCWNWPSRCWSSGPPPPSLGRWDPVRVVLDANLPVDFGKLLTGHHIDSVHQRGWSDLDNGALLTACQREYDAFLTLDQSLRYQQNMRGRPIAVMILQARSNRLQDLSMLVPAILAALPTAPPGQVTLVGA